MIEQAVVTYVTPDGAYANVQIPRLTGMNHEHGPCPVMRSVLLTIGYTDVTDSHFHTIPVDDLEPGDNVLVTAVGGIADNWHVLGRLP